MSYEQFEAVIGEALDGRHSYTAEKLRSLYGALRADPDADIVQLTCAVCGLTEWQQRDDPAIQDPASEAASDSASFVGDVSDPDQVIAWYLTHHGCEYYSPFSEPSHFSGPRTQKWYEEMMVAIEVAIG